MNFSRTRRPAHALAVFALAVLFVAGLGDSAHATNYTLWIHGRNNGGAVPGNPADFRYWGVGTAAAGVNKRAVNWDGVGFISEQNYRTRDALDCYCTGPNWCYIAVHSAGDYHIGYALALFGGTARLKKNATPNSAGVCGNTDGKTQTGWNIKWVRAASGAAGGSELADIGSWVLSEKLTQDLVTSTARAKYNHNTTYGVTFYNYAGSAGTLYSAALPGQDDEAVSYHTTGGVAGTTGASFCNPGDFFCNDLNLGTSACEGGAPKWSYHTLKFRDDTETYNHFSKGAWLGIISQVRIDVAASAL